MEFPTPTPTPTLMTDPESFVQDAALPLSLLGSGAASDAGNRRAEAATIVAMVKCMVVDV